MDIDKIEIERRYGGDVTIVTNMGDDQDVFLVKTQDSKYWVTSIEISGFDSVGAGHPPVVVETYVDGFGVSTFFIEADEADRLSGFLQRA